MGTSAPPATGYADDQRVENWDSPVLYSDSNVNVGAGRSTSVMDVSRYAYVGGADLALDADITVTIVWYADKAAAVEVGRRVFVLAGASPQRAQYRLPNLGPWCQITWKATAGGAATHTSNIFATNRFHPLEFIPINTALMIQQGAPIAAFATLTLYPLDYYAGPVDVWYQNPGASTLSMQANDGSGGWPYAFQAGFSGSPNNNQLKFVTPPGAWRIIVNNTAGAGETYYLHIRPSQTGST